MPWPAASARRAMRGAAARAAGGALGWALAMSARLHLSHRTGFRYARPVSISHQLLRLTPRSFERQQVLSASIEVSPSPESTSWRTDAYGNRLTEIFVQSDHDELRIRAEAQVELLPARSILLDLSPAWEHVAAALQCPATEGAWEAVPFCYPSPQVAPAPALEFAAPLFPPGRPLLAATHALCEAIFSEFEYQGGITDVYTPIAEVLSARKGVCQDFAHLAIACLRAHGLPARYVSGYLHNRRDGAQLAGADASHAWLSVWCPEFGWVDFDPTNNLMPSQEHITLAWGRDYGDASPTTGFLHGGGSQSLEVEVEVAPISR